MENNINSAIISQTINNSSLRNTTSKTLNLLTDSNNTNILFLGIILVLTILLVISIIILIVLFIKRKKVKSVSGKNMVLNKIILKNPNNNISLNIVNPKDFQKLQNTSNVSESGIIQPNNVLNEIKSQNLKEEIHKIINNSGSSDSSRGKRGKRKRPSNKNEKDIINFNENKEMSFDSKNIINDKEKENAPEVNTQKLEKEIKEQIKKYVIEENNI